MEDTITVIDWSKQVADIDNLEALPPEARRVFDSAQRLESRGFQEMLGYVDRQCVFACGGYWTNRDLPIEQQKFHITSMGNGTQLFVE